MKKTKLFAILMALFLLSGGIKAQFFTIDPIYYTIFDKDSLSGFDETSARAAALSEGYYGSEFKIKMYRQKRDYIVGKYSLYRAPVVNNTDAYLQATRPAAVPGCMNEDFEASSAGQVATTNQINGWTITGGYMGFIGATSAASLQTYFPNGLSGASSCNLTGCCPMPPSHSELIDCSAPGGYFDATIGNQYHIYSVFGTGTVSGAGAANPQIITPLGGSKVLRLNDEITGDYSMERLSKTFAVTASNALFQFAFISVFSPGHACCSAGGLQIKLSNATTNQSIPCPQFSVSAPSSQCTGTVPMTYYNVGTGTLYDPNLNFNDIYHPWKINSMDLSSYIGQNITIDVIVGDCDAGGHYGCVYFDAQCGPMTVYGNGNAYDAGTNVTVPTCGAAGATICAADGMGPYSWGGPNLPPGYSVPSMTNQCLVTSTSSQYTLYMQPAGSCVPIVRIVNSTITPAPLLNGSVLQAQCGGTLAVISLTPSGSAANPSSLSWSPTPVSLSSNTLIGSYIIPTGQTPSVIAITASDPLGCKVTTTLEVNPAPPIPTFSIQNTTNTTYSITCTDPVLSLTATTSYSYNNGTLDYFWASNSTTFNASSVNINVGGTYTIVGTDPVTNCGISHTITVGVNTVSPISTVGPLSQVITCASGAQNVTVTASPSVNVTHMLLAQQGGTTTANTYSALYLPTIGTTTYILKNDINGCTTQKTFTVSSSDNFPIFTVASPLTNFTLGCNSTSCANISIENPSIGSNGPISFTLLVPGASSVLPVGPGVGLSGTTLYNVCAPGNYTAVTRNNTTGCETRVPVSILQNTFTPAIAAVADRYILDCTNRRVTLKGQSITPNIEYKWSFNGNNQQVSDTITVFSLPATPTKTLVDTYVLTIKDLYSTCQSTLAVPIYQNLFIPLPVLSISSTSITCTNPSIQFVNNQSKTGIPGATGFSTIQAIAAILWEGPTPQEPKANSSFYDGLVSGPYFMTVMDMNNGCVATGSINIIDGKTYPSIVAPTAASVLDCGATSATLTPVISNAVAGMTYTWNVPSNVPVINGTNSLTLKPTLPGEYNFIVRNTSNGCLANMSYDVVNGTLTANFDADNVTGFVPLTVNFTNNSSSTNGNTGVNSAWNFGNGTSVTYSTVAGASALYTQPGTYTITLYATKGTCMESVSKVIRLDIPSALTIPNVFTPNNDGANDIFFVKATNLGEITAVIFDRWGHKVYEVTSDTGNIEWDGKNLQGKDAAEGTYFFSIKATGKDGSPYDKKGTINLYR